jgi:catechol 2,3-dioxygenase-like lactoylglutathione lyase family enzyme
MIPNRGLRHVALRVKDVGLAVAFYQRVFGMVLVWQPDADNAYLSSGCDNLALHRGELAGDPATQPLDHIGFIVPTIEEVERAYEWASQNAIPIANPLRHHRDGSVSFYILDPDGNRIQVLYEPNTSPLKIGNGARERGGG